MNSRAWKLQDVATTAWSAASQYMERSQATLLFEDQAGLRTEQGRSIVLTDPCRWLVGRAGQYREEPTGRPVDDPLQWIVEQHEPAPPCEDLPFVGGIAGYLGFEFAWQLDDLNVRAKDGGIPDLWVGVFEAAAIHDHRRDSWSVVGRNDQAVRRVCRQLREAAPHPIVGTGRGVLRSDEVRPESYCRRVEKGAEAIFDGEFFEVNYTERFRGRWEGDRRRVYDELRRRAPGGYGGVVDLPELTIASVSPEQFLCVEADGSVRTRPIKGTRPRSGDRDEDKRLAAELMASAKDRAENVMIVDLMRNDLSRICLPGSVEATEICGLHTFETVHHLVSTVEARLTAPFNAIHCLLACFPAGSITGAPKLRAMEWIAEHEATPRGPYTGSMFYWSDHGRLDSNVLIRTAVMSDNDVEYGSGGAVVADSEPQAEYEEAIWKARPFIELLESR